MAEYRAIECRVGTHRPHVLHDPTRPWPETNCYIDLWIEVLHALGRDPLPLMGLAAAMDWEVDHFTFLKPSAADIADVSGLTLHELALWDDLEQHVVGQVSSGAIPVMEVDGYFLPDTGESAYRLRHTKTTVAIIALDPKERWIEYFHNAGLFRLGDDDYDGIMGRGPFATVLPPFTELVRPGAQPGGDLRLLAREWLRRSARSRRPGNPIAKFAAALPALLDRVDRDPTRIHALCFNTTRQLGSTFGLLAAHLDWLGQDGSDAAWIADTAKSLQFQIARAARRGRSDPAVAQVLIEMASVWSRCTFEFGPTASPSGSSAFDVEVVG